MVDVLHKLEARGASDGSLALLFKTHPPPGDRLSQLGDMLTPNLARLPAGREPEIRRIAAGAGPMGAAQPQPAAGMRGLAEQAAPQAPAQPPKGGATLGPAPLLRGLFGR